MAITVNELRNSRTGGDTGRTFIYRVKGTSSDLTAKASVESTAPSSYDGLTRNDVQLESQVDNQTWRFRVVYGDGGGGGSKEKPKEVGDSSFRFDTAGGSEHITQSLDTKLRLATAGLAPNQHGAIGVVPGQGVEGCDITVPKFTWSDTHCFSGVSAAYINALYSLTGKVNDDFYSNSGGGQFESGEVLFLGAQGAVRTTDSNWELQFFHAARENQYGLTVGDMGGIDKRGWDYMWIMYEDDEDEDTIIKVPRFVYVEQVYHAGDFDDLGF